MNEEDILRGVASRARQDDDDSQLAVLERLARGERVEPSELAGIDEDTIALFRPIDAGAERRIADAILKPRLAEVRPLRPAWVRWSPLVAAAAAAAVFFVWPRGRDALPLYTFEISGNVAQLRADGPQVVEARAKLHKEATLEIVLRPETKAAGPIAVRAALVRDGKASPWSPPVDVSEDGAVRIVGPVKALFPDLDRPWEIVIAIGPEGELPRDAAALLAASREGSDRFRVVRGYVELVP